LEDPTNENILYAGCFRGVYISIDRGKTWSYLGNKMPGTAISDLEIHTNTMDLIAATHGRGIYKINLLPIHTLANKKFPLDKDYLYDIRESQLPWFSSAAQTPDYRTIEKTSITFWLSEAKAITLSLRDTKNQEIWSTNLRGEKGLNEYRWDLIVSRETSDLPYFTQYEKYVKAGTYNIILLDGKSELSRTLMIKERDSTPK
jgi:hypothetical protein